MWTARADPEKSARQVRRQLDQILLIASTPVQGKDCRIKRAGFPTEPWIWIVHQMMQ
jgi:hypothetical protein